MIEQFMAEAIWLSKIHMEEGDGGPFGCVIVKDNKIIGKGWNNVIKTNDPTAHAEMNAIKDACANLGQNQLEGCTIYTSCEPCPMCMGAIYWARPERVYFANTRADAAAIGFDDEFIYNELNIAMGKRNIPFLPVPSKDALKVFEIWKNKEDKIIY